MTKGQADPRFDGVRYSIHDYTECNSLTVTQSDIEMVGAMDYAGAMTNPNIKIAIITDRDDVMKAVQLQCEIFPSPYETRIFKTLADARQWIGHHPINEVA